MDPFLDHAFMQRALGAALLLGLSGAPLGLLLVWRRMSLVGDAMAHALLPGAALSVWWVGGLSLAAMSLGAFGAALLVAWLAGGVSRLTAQREDASFAALYLPALALGVVLVSAQAQPVDLLHLLFGSVLAVDDAVLSLVAEVALITALLLPLIWRALVLECVDPGFLRARGLAAHGAWAQRLFLLLLVAHLVAGFTALGTLMAVGLLMLPALAARFWARTALAQVLAAAVLAALAAWGGLWLSFQHELPSGPAIVLLAGALYLASLLAGPQGSLLRRFVPALHHRTA